MSNVKLGAASQTRLNQVRPDLKAVCYKAFETMPFDVTITEGLRPDETVATSGLRFLSNGMKINADNK